MLFTKEEYEIMIVELTQKDPMRFDMMCEIALRVLGPKVKVWCYDKPSLRSRQMSDDIMQEILMHLMTRCVTHFLRREDHRYEINHNPEEFSKWIMRVGKNYVKSVAKKQQSRDYKDRRLQELLSVASEMDSEPNRDQQKVADAFRLAFTAPKKVHIAVTWIAQSAMIINWDITKIKATQLMEEAFSDKTLAEVWFITRQLLSDIPWISVSPVESESIEARLNEDYEGKPAGLTIYKEYYGTRGGRAAISDWVYRMNSWIKTRLL